MNSFSGIKILMFSPYGATKHYGEAIKQELINRGATLYGYDERPSQKVHTKILIRLFKKKVPQIFIKYLKRVIASIPCGDIDFILICRGEAFTNEAIDLLKKKCPKAKLILYLWDILETTNISEIINRFDKAMSFDPYDVSRYDRLEFRPTFYVPQYADNTCKNADIKYDILFIGTLHSKRYKIIKRFSEYFAQQSFSAFIYLYVPGWIVYLKDKLLKYPYIELSLVNFSPITLMETVDKVNECKCVLDINYSTQKSLSMRAYEALAARKKYITTNSEVKKYDFYNPNNILVIDIDAPVIPKEFVESPFEEIPEYIVRKYSIPYFVDELFHDISESYN